MPPPLLPVKNAIVTSYAFADPETFQSILKSFIRLDLDSVSPPVLSEDWKPKVFILAANGSNN
jgi:hypothetical protein